MLSAIIVAGGNSQRMGFDKLFAPLNGEPVLAHALRAVELAKSVDRIVLVSHADRLAECENLVLACAFEKVIAIVPGGARRQDSVARGLAKISSEDEYVAVHDAARPLVRPELIEQIFAAAQLHGGAASGAPVIDTLKRVNEQGLVIGGVGRANLFAVETPQIFRRELMEQAFQDLSQTDLEVTDEISAVEKIGGQVILVPNESPNFKITYPGDLALAELVLRQRPI